MRLTPDPYQQEGIEWLSTRRRAMLADEPGLGKTMQAIRAVDRLPALFVLVVCPASLVTHWHRQVEEQSNGTWSVFVTSYEGLAGKHKDFVMTNSWCVVIFDEGHFLKNAGSKRTKAAYGDLSEPPGYEGGVLALADWCWTLTGTPMPNHSGELYSHLRALDADRVRSPKTGRVWTQQQFEAHFCEMRHAFVGMQIVGTKNDAKLNEKLDGFMLRRLKKDVLPQLPSIRFGELYVDAGVTDEDLGIDPEDIAKIREALETKGVEGLKNQYTHFAALRRATGLAKVKPVIEWLRMWLETTDKKIVVFGHHTDALRAIYHARGINEWAVKIEGSTTQPLRQPLVDRFQTDPKVRVMIGQIGAAGTGLTMTAASDMLFLESSWVPADNAQASMRIHRIGQKNACVVRFAMLPRSIDEQVQKAVMRKSESIARVLGDA
ncbi:SNF2 family DNA or RNA helicase [Rhizobium azooxidifex]|uniref:SNF2 family DNA or RNA helicase n=1 Tax=Mycoplana azooxidifex TaxID=1636188 RepID=A0A7W6DF44_9HYPH|nr:DEAD/DEAH box helicase [Mycoplana azooxidifex]MBB3980126.1 SNF2 family DNA or RNA helicase [Mycoplana azooxidifex]